jgi:hypothetical protein
VVRVHGEGDELMITPNFDAIPQEFKGLVQWVLWRSGERKGKLTKIPFDPWGRPASSTDRQTWGAFSTVVEAYQKGGYDGIGFVLTPPYVGFDADHCILEDGGIQPQAERIIKLLASYAERSPSGKGIHVIAKGKIPQGRKKGAFEMYQIGRYFTMTGDHLPGTPTTIEERPEEIAAIYQELFENNETASPSSQAQPVAAAPPVLTDEQVIALATEAHNSDKFLRLMAGDTTGYASESEADAGLAALLGFYTRDQAQICRIIQRSKLWDEKWERRDYQERTIGGALEKVTEHYNGDPGQLEGEGKEASRTSSEDYNPPLTRERANEIEGVTGVHIYNAADDIISSEELEALPLVENPRLEINLEPENAIMCYIKYGKKTGDAYPEYHYGMALSNISIATARNLVLKLKQGDIFPNIWAFLLGRSTISRKTAAIAKGEQFAKDLFPYASLPQSYSPEGLIEELSENPRSYLIKDEAGAMLAAMQKNYMLEMRDLYCVLYDCQSYKRKLRSGQRKERKLFEIIDPYINIVTATTPETFREYTTLLDLTSGWLLRFIYFYPNYRKDWMAFKPVEEEDFALYGEVLGRLSRIKGMFYNREKPLEIFLEPEAWEYYQAWQEARESEMQDTTDSIELALWGRLAFYALKLAMLFTVGRSGYREDTKVSLAHITEACRQIDEYFLPVGRLVAEEVARGEATNLQNKILGTLSRNGGRILRKDLLKALHATLRDVRDALDALKQSEEISIVERKGNGKPATWVILNEKEEPEKAKRESSHKSQWSQNNNSRKNSDDITCSNGTVATFATIATIATIGTMGAIPVDGEEKDDSIPVPDLQGQSPAKIIKLGMEAGVKRWEEKTGIGPHPRRDMPTPGQQKDEFRALLRFLTDYSTEWPRGNGKYETLSYLAGDECNAPLERAIRWQSRGVAKILDVDLLLEALA